MSVCLCVGAVLCVGSVCVCWCWVWMLVCLCVDGVCWWCLCVLVVCVGGMLCVGVCAC